MPGICVWSQHVPHSSKGTIRQTAGPPGRRFAAFKRLRPTKVSSQPKETSSGNSARQQSPHGMCWLAGVGPGGWDHVTMKVARLISEADVIVYDDLGTKELLSAAADDCEQVYVGKRGGMPSIKQAEINDLLVVLCKQGKSVLRLKGGCPSTFSRVSSEAAALAAAGCHFEMVPGVSTATAAPVLAGLPLTDSQLSGCYAVVTAHDPHTVTWEAFTHIPTLVILMGGRALAVIVDKLLNVGWRHTTPVAVIKSAGTADQQVWYSTLSSVVSDTRDGTPLSPCVVVVGEVAALPQAWRQVQEDCIGS